MEARAVRQWSDDIEKALEARRKYAASDDWGRWEDCYLGKFPGAKIPVNYFFAFARALIPHTYFRNPTVSVNPRSPGDAARARVLETVLNWTIGEIALKREMKRAIFDTFLYGTGILKLGYDSQYGFAPDQVVGEAMTPDGDLLDLSDQTLTARNRKDFTLLETNANIQPGMPWALRVNPREFVIDPAATCVEDAAWCAHRVVRRLRDIKADSKYNASATRDLKPNASKEFRGLDETRMVAGDTLVARDAMPDEKRRPELVEDDWVELWEVRDARTRRILVVATGHDKLLRDESDELQLDGLPYVALVFNGNPRSFWGVPDAQIIYPQQLELNEIRTRQQELRRASVKRYALRQGVLTADQKQRFLTEDSDAFIEFPPDVQNIGEAFKEMMGGIPADMNAWSNIVVQDMQDMLGMGRNQMGQFDRGAMGGSGRRTATEADIVQQSSQMRVSERRDVVADSLQMVARRISQMVFKFWSAKKWARVSDPGGAVSWVQYTGEELRGEYDFTIEPDDALPMGKRQRRQDALQLFQTLAPAAQSGVVNLPELVKFVVRQFDGANADSLVQAPPAPQAVPQPPGEEPMPGEGNAYVQLPMQAMPPGV